MTGALSDYCPELSTSDLIATIRALFAHQRRAERLVCRYLADLSDRLDAGGYPAMSGFGDIYHAARCLFSMSTRGTRERLRVGARFALCRASSTRSSTGPFRIRACGK